MKALRVVALVIVFLGLLVSFVGLEAAADGLAVLRPSIYVGALDRAGLFNLIPEVVVQASGESMSALPKAEQEKVAAAIQATVTPEAVAAEFRAVLGDLFAFLKGRQAEVTAVVHLDQFRDAFLAEYAKTANPYAYRQVEDSVKRSMPGPVPLSDFVGSAPAFAQAARYIHQGIDLAVWVAVAAALLAALAFLLAGGFVGGARWVGIAALIAGVAGAVVFVFARGLIPGFAAGFVMEGIPPEVLGPLSGAVLAILNGIARTIIVTAAIFGVSGLVLIVASGVLGAARAKRQASGGAAAHAGTRAGGATPSRR